MIHSRPVYQRYISDTSDLARHSFPLTQAIAVSATPHHHPLALKELDPRSLETFLIFIYF